MKVKAIINFNDLQDKTKRKAGDIFECTKERAIFLLEHEAVKFIEENEEITNAYLDDKPIKPKKKKSNKK